MLIQTHVYRGYTITETHDASPELRRYDFIARCGDKWANGATLTEVKAEIDEREGDGVDMFALGLAAWGVLVTLVAVASHWFWEVVV